MKKKLRFILGLVLVAAIIATSAILIANLAGPKRIKVGVFFGNPMAYKDSNGEWTGFDVQFANKMFEELGYAPEFVEVTAQTREKMLEKGEIDCFMSGTDVSNGNFIYSEDYISSTQVVFHKNLDGVEVNSKEDLKKYRVAVLNNSKNQRTLNSIVNPVNILEHATNEKIVEMLDINDIEVAIGDYMFFENLTKENPAYKDATVGIIYDMTEHVIVFPEKKEKLLKKVNEVIEKYDDADYFEALKIENHMENYYD